MPALRQRSWTRLFLMLTLCGNFLIPFVGRYSDDIAVGIIFGQMIVVGVWTVLDSAHRLLRAVVFTIAFAVLAYLLKLISSESSLSGWTRNLSVVFVLQGTVALASFVAWTIQSWLARWMHHEVQTRGKRRFRLVEMFAWMGVVAVVSSLLRGAQIHAFFADSAALPWIALCVMSGFCCLLLAGPERAPPTLGIPAAVAAMAIFFAFTWSRLHIDLVTFVTFFGAAYAYVGCYLACCVLDDRGRTMNAAAGSD